MTGTGLERGFGLEGHVWLRRALTSAEIEEMRRLGATLSRVTSDAPLFQAVAASRASRMIAERWPGMRPVRIVCFDKTAGSNWSLPWHQDRVIAVAQKAEVPGYDNWTRKDGMWHCEPPEAVLRRMLFVRLHLDDCDASTGAMEIALGSNRAGLVPTAEAERVASSHETQVTEAQAGDVLVLPMLTLHRSSPSKAEVPRRVLRVDFADAPLPAPLAWAGG